MLVFLQAKGSKVMDPMYDISRILARVINGRIIKFKPLTQQEEVDGGRKTKEYVMRTPETNINPYILEGTGEPFLTSYRSLGARGQGTFIPDQVLKFLLDFPEELEGGNKNAFRVRRTKGNGDDVVVILWKEGNNVVGEKHDIRSPKIWLPENNVVFWIPSFVTPFRQ